MALALSATFHLIILGVVINQAPPEYVYPEPTAAPLDVQIVTMPEIPPITIPPPPKVEPPVVKPEPTPPVTPPTPPKPEPAKPQQPRPEPARPEPPKPAPAQAAAPKAAPAKPSPLPAPVAPTRTPAPPSPAPTPRLQAKAAVASPSATVRPVAPISAAPAARIAASLLNIHKALRQAPANVPTLPMAPSGGQAGAPGSTASGTPATGTPGAPGETRAGALNGLPYGAMPSGGPGLRGTLVGCANADAVRLTGAERNHCNERFGVEAAKAPALDGISPAKRAAFDRAAGRQEANRRYRDTTSTGAVPTEEGGIARGPASTVILPNAEGPK